MVGVGGGTYGVGVSVGVGGTGVDVQTEHVGVGCGVLSGVDVAAAPTESMKDSSSTRWSRMARILAGAM